MLKASRKFTIIGFQAKNKIISTMMPHLTNNYINININKPACHRLHRALIQEPM